MAKKYGDEHVGSMEEGIMLLTIRRPEGPVETIYSDDDIWISKKGIADLFDINVGQVSNVIIATLEELNFIEKNVSRLFKYTKGEEPTRYYNYKLAIAVGNVFDPETTELFKDWVKEAKPKARVEYAKIKEAEKSEEEKAEEIIELLFEGLVNRIHRVTNTHKPILWKINELYALAFDYSYRPKDTQRFLRVIANKLAWTQTENTQKGPLPRSERKKNNKSTANKVITASDQSYTVHNEDAQKKKIAQGQLLRLVQAYFEHAEDMLSQRIVAPLENWETLLAPLLAIADDVTKLNDIDAVNSVLVEIKLDFVKYIRVQRKEQDLKEMFMSITKYKNFDK